MGDGESAMAVKSLGTGPVAGLGEDVGVWTGVRWKVVGCSGSGTERKKEGSEQKRFVCVSFVAFGMGWEAMALLSTFGVRAYIAC